MFKTSSRNRQRRFGIKGRRRVLPKPPKAQPKIGTLGKSKLIPKASNLDGVAEDK
jgi:hypothetical protein